MAEDKQNDNHQEMVSRSMEVIIKVGLVLGLILLCFFILHPFILITLWGVIISVSVAFRILVAGLCVRLLARAMFPDWVKSPVFSPVFANLITGYFFWRLWKNFFLLSKLIRDRPASYPKQLGEESPG